MFVLNKIFVFFEYLFSLAAADVRETKFRETKFTFIPITLSSIKLYRTHINKISKFQLQFDSNLYFHILI